MVNWGPAKTPRWSGQHEFSVWRRVRWDAHPATDVLAFFKLIDLHEAKDLDIHVVLDSLSTHKAPPVAKWLADPKRDRWHLHFTPTSSSWLILVEQWFGELAERRLRRGVFTSVPNLIEAIEIWAEHWNDDPKPVVWHKSAQKLSSKYDQLSG